MCLLSLDTWYRKGYESMCMCICRYVRLCTHVFVTSHAFRKLLRFATLLDGLAFKRPTAPKTGKFGAQEYTR